MVRTFPSHTPQRLDVSRILSTSFALLLHAAALLILLVPLGQVPLPTRAERTPERWTIQPPVPPTPLPPQPVTQLPPRVEPSPRIVPIPQPTPQIQAQAVIDTGNLPAIAPPASISDPSPATLHQGGPLQGAQLRYASAPAPRYPQDALRSGDQGTVLLRVLVDVDGKPIQVAIETSSGHRSLDREAVRHVQQRWRFVPAEQNGQQVQAWGLVPITFSLQ